MTLKGLEDNLKVPADFKTFLEKLYNDIVSNGLTKDKIQLVIWCIENSPKDDKLILSLISDIIDETRIFNYKELFLDNFNIDLKGFETPLSELKKALYHYEENIFFTPDQDRIVEEFLRCRRLIVSAPTSFGKSLLIPRLIEMTNYNNIALVVPTKALLYETTARLMKNKTIREKYNLINSTITKEIKDKNIFIMTPERLDSYLDEVQVKIDFFVVDEIYKVSNAQDNRNIVFSNIIYRLLKDKIDFYMIGPFFNNFSPAFRERYKANFLRFDQSVVNHYFYDFNSLSSKESLVLNRQTIKKFKGVHVQVKNVLKICAGTSLVYIGNKASCEAQAKNYALERVKQGKKEVNNIFIEYLEEEISKEWTLLNCLKAGVAFHHGSMPKFIQVELIEMLNRSEIDTIYCTPTIIEGVNTSAKNVIIADSHKGREVLTALDKKNIYGRAGRFSKHFSGNVININSELVDENASDFDIDFPLLDKDDLSHEEVILLEDSDVKSELNKKKKEELVQELNLHNIPYSLIKSNKYISYKAQIALVNYLRSNPDILDLLIFKQLPAKENSSKALDLCFEYLFSRSDQESSDFNIGNLKRVTHFYIYKDSSYGGLKEIMGGQHENTKIRRMFKLINHYFEFVLPRCLKVLESIVNFVAKEQGKDMADYGAYIYKIEYGTAEEHEILLREFGFPPALIRKISKFVIGCSDPKSIIAKLREIDLRRIRLHQYELRFLRNLIS